MKEKLKQILDYYKSHLEECKQLHTDKVYEYLRANHMYGGLCLCANWQFSAKGEFIDFIQSYTPENSVFWCDTPQYLKFKGMNPLLGVTERIKKMEEIYSNLV
jgi:hypothetical protein